MAKVKDYVAILTISELPRTKESHDVLVKWLRDKAKEMGSIDPNECTEPLDFILMK